MTITTSPKFLASDMVGHLVVDEGMVYYLTTCCKASAKGSSVGDGILCRGCYSKISDEMGRAWMADDEQSWALYADRMRPWLEEFTERFIGRVKASAQKAS